MKPAKLAPGQPSFIGRRFGLTLAVGLAALAMAGCQSRGGLGDVTGSIGRSQASQPRSAAEWQVERESWAKRYDANPKDRNAAFYYARALRALELHAQALAVLQNAVLVHQDDRELLGAYGRSLADSGRLREADEVLSRAHSPERPDWRILSAQGTVADQLGEHERAQQIYQAALKLAPDEPTVMSNYGLSLALSRRLPEAERVLKQAAASERADIRVRQNLVLVLGLQGRFAEAEILARQDQSLAEAATTIAYLKRSVSQQNSWDLLKGAKGRAQPAVKPPVAQGSDHSTVVGRRG
ncbi:Flp pilus assembly protein TadD, contains TPR repeat [Hyphomicrobiales bacterium]|nr:Flp pilus assembly protein TadD, contains TPR repeat [Hyphomicrobiales bacterium]CAH1697921.1 Flp pilus assembly protein TadD, contains TPR repeat [Hyphomicrobiales bacterium]CAI0347567.1 Flp pilus assembly protein TadD [Hyphomicrobiales bacterium]